MVTVNLAGQELREFGAVPAGTYSCALDRAELRTSAARHPSILWIYKILDVLSLRDPDEEPAKLVGRTIIDGTSLQEQSLWAVFRTLTALGADPKKIQGKDGVVMNEAFVNSFKGQEVLMTVIVREYEGQDQNQVVSLKAPTAGALT